MKKIPAPFRQSKRSLAAVLPWLIVFLSFLPPAVRAGDFDPSFRDWNAVLSTYTKDGRVDYASLQKNPGEWQKALLNTGQPARADYAAWSEAEKKAFLINAYNAAVIKLVLQYYPIRRTPGWKAFRYPVSSVQQIPEFWRRDLIRILGEPFTLDGIEAMLQKDFGDPRVHFALVPGSLGGPRLRGEAYTGARLEEQLEDQVKLFLANPGRVSYDGAANVLRVSPVFKWFREDFEKAAGSVPGFIQKHTNGLFPPTVLNAGIEYLSYDWALNDQKTLRE